LTCAVPSGQMVAEGGVEPAQVVGPVHAVDAAGAGAVAVEAEGRHSCDDVRGAEVVRTSSQE